MELKFAPMSDEEMEELMALTKLEDLYEFYDKPKKKIPESNEDIFHRKTIGAYKTRKLTKEESAYKELPDWALPDFSDLTLDQQWR